MIINYIIIY